MHEALDDVVERRGPGEPVSIMLRCGRQMTELQTITLNVKRPGGDVVSVLVRVDRTVGPIEQVTGQAKRGEVTSDKLNSLVLPDIDPVALLSKRKLHRFLGDLTAGGARAARLLAPRQEQFFDCLGVAPSEGPIDVDLTRND
jgi:hypothetical protein